MNNKLRKEIFEMYCRNKTIVCNAPDVIRSVPYINMSQVSLIMSRSFKHHIKYEYYVNDDTIFIVRYLRDKISSIQSKS